MKRAGVVLKLVFGVLGAVYAVLGSMFLVLAVKAAGDFRRIFTLPEEELVFAILGTVFTALGVIFLLVAFILMLADRRRARLREELLQWGSRVQGTVTDVRVDHTVRVNGLSPVIAWVRCALPSGEITLKSRRLWSATPNTGDTVDVLYDPQNEKLYVIEFPGENGQPC